MRSEERLKFYKTKRWQQTRNAYLRSVGGLCENCLKKGIYKPAEIVHHKIHLDDVKLHNPEIALSWDNLEALCRLCHAEEHEEIYESSRPYKVDEYGRVIIKEPKNESVHNRAGVQCRSLP